MAKIINLRRARKARVREEADRQAAENRRTHGRTKAEREAAKVDIELRVRRLDAHRRDAPDGESR